MKNHDTIQPGHCLWTALILALLLALILAPGAAFAALPVVSNVTAAPVAGPEEVKDLLTPAEYAEKRMKILSEI